MEGEIFAGGGGVQTTAGAFFDMSYHRGKEGGFAVAQVSSPDKAKSESARNGSKIGSGMVSMAQDDLSEATGMGCRVAPLEVAPLDPLPTRVDILPNQP